MARSLRVLLAGDQYLAREGTRSLLDNHGGLEVVGVAADYDRVLADAAPEAGRSADGDQGACGVNNVRGDRGGHQV